MSDTIIASLITGFLGIIAVIVSWFLARFLTEKRLKKTEDITHSLSSCNLIKMVKKATKCIFMSGIGMSPINNTDLQNTLAC